MTDTSEEVLETVRSLLLARTGSVRIRLASDMFDSARRMALASLPSNASAHEIAVFLRIRIYPELQWDEKEGESSSFVVLR